MNKLYIFLIITYVNIFYAMEYHQHRNCGLQIYTDVLISSQYEKLKKETNNTHLKNKYSLLSFSHSIESMQHKELISFIKLLEDEYLKEKTVHHFTDLAIAKVFLEKKYPDLHIGTNRIGLSNVFTDHKRIEDFTFNLALLQDKPEFYEKIVERLSRLEEKNNNSHSRVNFAIALSLANKDIREKFDKKRKSHL